MYYKSSIYLLAIFVLLVLLCACDKNQVSTLSELKIEVRQIDGSPVEGVVVKLYSSQSDFIRDRNSISSGITDDNGSITFSESEFLNEGSYFFDASLGSKTNWVSTYKTDSIEFGGGSYTSVTFLEEIPEGYRQLINEGPWTTCAFFVGTEQQYPTCISDDFLQFLKLGVVLRHDGASSCPMIQNVQIPLARGDNKWSSWALNTDGTELIIRDLDPFWNGGVCNLTNGQVLNCFATDLVFNADGTITIDYSRGNGMGKFRAILCPR